MSNHVNPNYGSVVVTLKSGEKRVFHARPADVFGMAVWRKSNGSIDIQGLGYDDDYRAVDRDVPGTSVAAVATFAAGEWVDYQLVED